ncbi:hypothetical protein [Streptomyces prunicolor]
MSTAVGRRRVPVWLGIGVVVLAAVGGGSAWLLRDEHPFGDARACAGSDLRLPGVITAGGATIPTDASDVHYYTHNGSAQVTFTSGLVSDYLRRAGIVPEGKELFDKKYGEPAVDDDALALPDGLCGSSLREAAWAYHSTAANGTGVAVTVEQSTLVPGAFRFPARVVVGYTTA